MTAAELLAILETPACSVCNGVGSVPLSPESIPGDPLRMKCPGCNGTLREPTDAGYALLKFIKDHTDLKEIRPRPRLLHGEAVARPGELYNSLMSKKSNVRQP